MDTSLQPLRERPAPSRRPPALLASDLLPLGDIVCLLLSATLTLALGARWMDAGAVQARAIAEVAPAGWFAAALAPFMLYDAGFGIRASRGAGSALLAMHALRFVVYAAVVLALGLVTDALDAVPRGALVLWLVLAWTSTSLMRSLVAAALQRLRRQGRLTERVAVVGAGPLADRMVQTLARERAGSVELLGVFDDALAPPGATPVAGTIAQLIDAGTASRIDWIVLALPPDAGANWLATLQRLQALPAAIALCPQYLPPSGAGAPAGLLVDRPLGARDRALKAGEDLLLGGTLTLLLLPLLALIALAIRLDSPGPILYRQRRHALNNHEFDIYKFRTMQHDADAAQAPLLQTQRGDPRVTRVGRFLRAASLDELPQLFNVLEGTMSLVGPRPHATQMRTEQQLGSEITASYAHRHRVKPGITGWAQVNGARGATHTREQLQRRVELDLYYIDHWSLLLDLRILALTVRAVVRPTNAF